MTTIDMHMAKALKYALDWKRTHPQADACECATATIMNANVVVGRMGAEFDDLGHGDGYVSFLRLVGEAI